LAIVPAWTSPRPQGHELRLECAFPAGGEARTFAAPATSAEKLLLPLKIFNKKLEA
jgi:hypothetical protein